MTAILAPMTTVATQYGLHRFHGNHDNRVPLPIRDGTEIDLRGRKMSTSEGVSLGELVGFVAMLFVVVVWFYVAVIFRLLLLQTTYHLDRGPGPL